ncbi:MAG TPA: ThuA domain-containing protein [Fimbriimonadaceae bacterium]|nr:ThuA domain-containing protein [Fimbriimonadaceae bacterium]
MARKALIVWGGWDGHEPEQVAGLFHDLLKGEGFDVEVSNDMDSFKKADQDPDLKLIVPIITMSKIAHDQREPVTRAVSELGLGIAGCHGGMCDAFREDTEWQFMTGGQWVSHPGNDGVRYTVNFDRTKSSPITEGLADFEVESEQYYLHTDPGNVVLATCDFPTPGVDGPHVQNPCKMPQVWTKMYGKGRVFYNALGHNLAVFNAETPRELMRRGFVWAAKG